MAAYPKNQHWGEELAAVCGKEYDENGIHVFHVQNL